MSETRNGQQAEAASHVSQTPQRRSGANPTAWLLLGGGAAMVAIGLIAGIAAKRQAEFDAQVNLYYNAMVLDNGGGLAFADASADYTGFIIGMVVAALGVVAIIGGLVVRGVRQNPSRG